VVTLGRPPAHDLLTHLAHIMDILDDPMLLHVLHKALLLSWTNCGLGDCSVLDLQASTKVRLLVTHLHIGGSIQYPTKPSQLLLCSASRSPTGSTPVLVDHPLDQIGSQLRLRLYLLLGILLLHLHLYIGHGRWYLAIDH